MSYDGHRVKSSTAETYGIYVAVCLHYACRPLTVSIYLAIEPLADKTIAIGIQTCPFSGYLIVCP